MLLQENTRLGGHLRQGKRLSPVDGTDKGAASLILQAGLDSSSQVGGREGDGGAVAATTKGDGIEGPKTIRAETTTIRQLGINVRWERASFTNHRRRRGR